MLDLKRVFQNHFLAETISIPEVISYTGAHLAALIANNPGGSFDALIAATDTLLTALGGSLTDETVKLGVQKARTQAKRDFRAALSNEISKIHGAALAQYGRKGAGMQLLFPSDLEPFGGGTDDALETALDALDLAVHADASLSADTKTLAHKLATDWDSLNGAAGTGKAGKTSAAEKRRAANLLLRAQLFQNLLALAAKFPDQPEKADLYCPQYLLEDPVRTPEKPAPTPATPPKP